jgi:hypothetical protein
MTGLKLDQTKESMIMSLDSLNKEDHLTIVTFNTNVNVWPPNGSYPATGDYKRKALKYVLSLTGK